MASRGTSGLKAWLLIIVSAIALAAVAFAAWATTRDDGNTSSPSEYEIPEVSLSPDNDSGSGDAARLPSSNESGEATPTT